MQQCSLWSAYEQFWNKMFGENLYGAIWNLKAALSACENGSGARTRKRNADNNETNTLSQDGRMELLQ